ncbi:MAG: prenyltransferase/squalene oxidase repeat-containing protein [Verrucomicrobiota bacterium]
MKTKTEACLFLVLLLCLSSAARGQRVETVYSRFQPEVEASVERALMYLAKEQKPEGHFEDRFGKSTGIAGLVGMAFLSAGHIPGSLPYGETVERCLDYILEGQRSTGLIDRGDSGHGPMYAHNIATLFLSECSGMIDERRQEELEDVLAKATRLLLRAQAVKKDPQNQGGWRYKPDSRDSDLSCSGWALMALRSGKLNGAPVPDEAIEQAVAYIFRKHDQRMGTFGYMNPGDKHVDTLTGSGLLCLELCGYHGHPSTFRAGDYILENHRNLPKFSHEFYGNYYNAQGMFQLGGKYWEAYAQWMYEEYLTRQREDGSWHSGGEGAIYGTAMMVLSFTVPYRQLPIYQRDETVDEPF